jgi:hypothetical protein
MPREVVPRAIVRKYSGSIGMEEARMLHAMLLTVFTVGVATLTFALMALASLLSVATSGGRR